MAPHGLELVDSVAELCEGYNVYWTIMCMPNKMSSSYNLDNSNEKKKMFTNNNYALHMYLYGKLITILLKAWWHIFYNSVHIVQMVSIFDNLKISKG